MSSEAAVVMTMRSGPAAATLTVILLSACGSGGEDSSETVGSLDQIASVETEVVTSAASSSEPPMTTLTRWWRGAGDYSGLTFYMWVAGSEVGSPDYEWSGIIFPGDPPPTVAND